MPMSSQSPEITVLMSVFNGTKFLREAIESILNQTFADFEFLIIDDGSTDDSIEIIESYDDQRIKLVRNGENIGLTRSLNKGIKLSKGLFLSRMDADDVSNSDRLEKQLNYMDNNPEVSVCGSWLETIGERQEIWKCHEHDSEIKAQLLFNNSVYHPTAIVRKDFLVRNGFLYDESLSTAQDYGLWVAISHKAVFANIQEVLLKYRIHEDQVGKKKSSEQKENADISRKSIIKNLGLDVDPSNFNLHLQLIDPASDNNRCFLERSLKYFCCLVTANKWSGFIKNSSLEKLLSEKWWLICHNFPFSGLCSLIGVKSSLLKKLVDKGLVDKLHFFNSCMASCGAC